VTALEPRALPAPAVGRDRCSGCRRPIVWAITVAGPNGPGGTLQPLDPIEDPAGRIAVTAPHGRLLARALTKDETVDRPVEYSATTHFATCPAGVKPDLPVEVVDELAARRRRRGRARAGASR
jgi:hypothetical protein